jgi:aminoglycoside phosphotransferase (APT) family kinase protein
MSLNKMHADEIDISFDLIKDLLFKQFPKWSHLPLKLMRPEGTDNAMYRLGNDKLIRLPRKESSSFSIEKELTWLPKLGVHLPLSIPNIIAKGVSDKNYPFTWLILEWLDGSSPDKENMVDEHKAAANLASFVKSMQKIKFDGAPNCRRGKPLSTCDDEVKRSIPLLNGFYKIELLKNLWELALKTPQWKKDPVWVHGDLHAGNLLAKDKKIIGVIDFGLAGIGDPACDMMIAWTFLNKKSRKIFHSIVQPDKDTWNRGRGWALFLGIVGYPYYRLSNPIFAHIAKRALDEVVAERIEV